MEELKAERLYTDYIRYKNTSHSQTLSYLKGNGRVIMYRQTLNLTADKTKENDFLGYEVVLLKWFKGTNSKSISIPPGWYRSTDRDWGTYGWTFKSKQKADDKYNELIKDGLHLLVREKI